MSVPLMRRHPLVAPALCALLLLPGQAWCQRLAEPLVTANRNPFVQVYGLPAARSAQITPVGKLDLDITAEAANNFTADTGNGEVVAIDGETHRLSLDLHWGIGERWELALGLPWISHQGGGLDSLIEDWHDTFGFPDGGRPGAPQDRIDIRYSRNGESLVALDRSVEGVGDASLSTAYQWSVQPLRQWSIRSQLKLPTGDADDLTGSESTDLSVAVHISDQHWQQAAGLVWHANMGLLWMDGGEVLDAVREDWVLFGSATLAWMVTDSAALKLQLDAHSAFYDSVLTELGSDSAQLSLGAAFSLGKTWTIDMAIVEDVAVDTAPDAVFYLGLKKRAF